jgi:hypothetical protein
MLIGQDMIDRVPEIVFIDSSHGDLELLREAFREIDFKVLIKPFSKIGDGLRYLKVRYSENRIPPPHLVILGLSPFSDAGSILIFMAVNKVLEDVPIFIMGDLRSHPDRDIITHVASHPNVEVVPYTSLWTEQIELTKKIVYRLQSP